MTINEFLEELQQAGGTWQLEQKRYLRLETETTCSCPVVVVHKSITKKTVSAIRFETCARALDMTRDQLCEIAEASDMDEGYNKDLRARLLAACGLEEAV